MNKRLHWDDLRVILAIAEAGTLSGGGRRLGVSHATVFRRLGEIETRLGVKLFDRDRSGYTPTVAGEAVAESARRIEAEVLEVERRVAGWDLRPSGTVRITTTDTLFMGLLSPILAEFRRAYPDIAVEIVISNQLFNLSKREADVAVRPSSTPPENLVGRKVGIIVQAIYGQRDRVLENGGAFDSQTADWVGPDERMGYRELDRWLTAQGLEERCRYRVDTILGMLAAAREGAGLAVLPCYLGDRDERLRRVGDPLPDLATDLWLLTHPTLRRTARIRAVLDFIADAMKTCQNRLLGTG